MNVTPRMKQLLQVLLKEQEAISVKALADRIGVSKRTAQRELEYIDSALKGYEVRFLSRTGVGIWLEGSPEEKERLGRELCAGDDYDVSNKEERRKRLILEILKEKGLKKLFYYSSQAGVSEATVSTDLDAIEDWLNRQGLSVKRKPGSGIQVEGSEESYRKAIRAFIQENIDTRLIRESYQETDSESSYELLKKSNIGQILNTEIMEQVMRCITRMDNARFLTLTESSYMGLIIHISIAVNRIMKNEVIEADERWKENIKEDEDYRLACAIVKELEKEFEIQIPEVEISYICLHLKGAKHERISWAGEESAVGENRELQQLVNMLIDAFDQEKAYLLKQDDEFIQGLLAHLQPTLIRLIHRMQIQNPILEEIKGSYPDIYQRCERAAEVLKEYTGQDVPEEEIGFLTVHFGAALVRMEGRNETIRKVAVGVVCASGIGISRLMSSKLENMFRDRMIITTYGKKDITPYVAARTDFFVSSIPIDPLDVPVIYVNPLMNEEDIGKIRQILYRYERMPQKHKEGDKFSVQLEEISLMVTQINAVIKYMEFFKVDEGITFDELLIAIGEKLSPYSDRRELIRSDILRRERIASQVFAEFGFALLHTRTRGVIRPSFSVCMTRNLGPFQDPYLKKINAVFVMLAPDDENQKINNDILGCISSMLIEECDFLDIVARGQKEEIQNALSRHLKKYFNTYIAGLS